MNIEPAGSRPLFGSPHVRSSPRRGWERPAVAGVDPSHLTPLLWGAADRAAPVQLFFAAAFFVAVFLAAVFFAAVFCAAVFFVARLRVVGPFDRFSASNS